MKPLDSSTRLHVHPDLELAPGPGGSVVARDVRGDGLVALLEADLSLLREVVAAVTEHGEAGAVQRALSARIAEAETAALLAQLVSLGWLQVGAPAGAERAAGGRRVLLVGAGSLATAFHARLRDSGRLLLSQIEGPAQQDLPERVAQAELVICAAEGVPLSSVAGVERACVAARVPCLFATCESGHLLLGPTVVAGRTAGFREARLWLMGKLLGVPAGELARTFDALHAQRMDAEAPDAVRLLATAQNAVALEVDRVFDPERTPAWLSAVLVLGRDGSHEVAVPEPDTPGDAPDQPLGLDVDVALARRTVLTPRDAGPPPTTVRRVGIVGGGTAGYLTALALRRRLPDVEVTLIEASSIPVIGVGEATTALLLHFLHGDLGLDISDFYARVRPTWKLGIRFGWGAPGDYAYNSPFQFGRLLEALVYEGDIDRSCLASRMMTRGRVPVVRDHDGSHRSLLDEVPYAYHLDNRRFVTYLREEARRAGVRHVDAVVSQVVTGEAADTVDALVLEDGRRLDFELYVDCSGFRSLLLEGALGSRFESYASSLFTDGAVIADLPNAEGSVRPYTSAMSMDHGWCWTIPMLDADHLGYVYSSSFCSADEAEAEMRRTHPAMGNAWTTRFRSGRHEHFWKGNVVAIGNAYGFVEPLQSTAIHMVVVQIQKLLEAFPENSSLRAFQPLVNRRVAEVWDSLRYFLAAHYRYNDKLDTEFWRACRAGVDVSGAAELIAAFRERGPIGSTGTRLPELDHSTFGVFRHDLLFMGQRVPTQLAAPTQSRAEWARLSAAAARVVEHALPQREALAWLAGRPDVLHRHARTLV